MLVKGINCGYSILKRRGRRGAPSRKLVDRSFGRIGVFVLLFFLSSVRTSELVRACPVISRLLRVFGRNTQEVSQDGEERRSAFFFFLHNTPPFKGTASLFGPEKQHPLRGEGAGFV